MLNGFSGIEEGNWKSVYLQKAIGTWTEAGAIAGSGEGGGYVIWEGEEDLKGEIVALLEDL